MTSKRDKSTLSKKSIDCKQYDNNFIKGVKYKKKDNNLIKLWCNAGLHSKITHRRSKFKFSLPLGEGLTRINQIHDFQLPWNIYCPTTGKKLKWNSLRKNHWQNSKQHLKLLKTLKSNDIEVCDCQGLKCGENCFNKLFQIECNSLNCNIGEKDCGNRNFTNLSKKIALKNRYVNGVEVVHAGDKGHGLRSIRSYKPHDLIIEYTGEIIDQEEMEKRLNNDQSLKKRHYYFLSLGHGLCIDGGTRGSIARFANHSCEPNAEIQKWIVNGEPRIGLFAGMKGIQPGEEITYHYNFEWFPNAEPQHCYCGSSKCTGFIGKRSNNLSNNQSPSMTPLRNSPSPVESPIEFVNNNHNTEQNPYQRNPNPSRRLNRHADEDISFIGIVKSLPRHVQRQLSINMAPPGKEIDDASVRLALMALNAHGDSLRTRNAENESAIDAGIPEKYLNIKTESNVESPKKRKRVVKKSKEDLKKRVESSDEEEVVKPKRVKQESKRIKLQKSKRVISSDESSDEEEIVKPKRAKESRKSRVDEKRSKLQKSKRVMSSDEMSDEEEIQKPLKRVKQESKKVKLQKSKRIISSDESSEYSSDESDDEFVPNKLLPTRQLNDLEIKSSSRTYIALLKNLLIDDEVPQILEKRRRNVSLDAKSETKSETKSKSQTKSQSKQNKSQPKSKSEKSSQANIKIEKKQESETPKYLLELMIDDKLPTVYERTTRNGSKQSPSINRNELIGMITKKSSRKDTIMKSSISESKEVTISSEKVKSIILESGELTPKLSFLQKTLAETPLKRTPTKSSETPLKKTLMKPLSETPKKSVKSLKTPVKTSVKATMKTPLQALNTPLTISSEKVKSMILDKSLTLKKQTIMKKSQNIKRQPTITLKLARDQMAMTKFFSKKSTTIEKSTTISPIESSESDENKSETPITSSYVLTSHDQIYKRTFEITASLLLNSNNSNNVNETLKDIQTV